MVVGDRHILANPELGLSVTVADVDVDVDVAGFKRAAFILIEEVAKSTVFEDGRHLRLIQRNIRGVFLLHADDMIACIDVVCFAGDA